jgi:hypothetical protein
MNSPSSSPPQATRLPVVVVLPLTALLPVVLHPVEAKVDLQRVPRLPRLRRLLRRLRLPRAATSPRS